MAKICAIVRSTT